ncbi:hypothetical protein WG66_001683 [Moniliophthora roreri]|nr:hypothetical protein WG66_001683 [Moniliophthora roreri]
MLLFLEEVHEGDTIIVAVFKNGFLVVQKFVLSLQNQ